LFAGPLRHTVRYKCTEATEMLADSTIKDITTYAIITITLTAVRA
jgi:hypothetical protein